MLRRPGRAGMDPLEDVLSLLGTTSHLSTGLIAGGRWALSFPPPSGVKFNTVRRGQCYVRVEGLDEAIALREGDCFLLTQPRVFSLCSDLDLAPVDAQPIFEAAEDGMARTGEGEDVALIGGLFSFEDRARVLLLDALPPVIHVPAGTPEAASMQWALTQIESELRTQVGRRDTRGRTSRPRHADPCPPPAPGERTRIGQRMAHRTLRPDSRDGPERDARRPRPSLERRATRAGQCRLTLNTRGALQVRGGHRTTRIPHRVAYRTRLPPPAARKRHPRCDRAGHRLQLRELAEQRVQARHRGLATHLSTAARSQRVRGRPRGGGPNPLTAAPLAVYPAPIGQRPERMRPSCEGNRRTSNGRPAHVRADRRTTARSAPGTT